MFLERETVDPNNKNYLSKPKDLIYSFVIHDSTTTFIANMIFLANKPSLYPIIQHLKESIFSGCFLSWSILPKENHLGNVLKVRGCMAKHEKLGLHIIEIAGELVT